MVGVELLQRAESSGLRLVREGDTVHVHGPKEAAPIVREIAAHKGDVLCAWWSWQARRLLSAVHDVDLRQDLEDIFEETASTREYVQNQTRESAEAIAFGSLVTEMVWRGLPVVINVERSASR